MHHYRRPERYYPQIGETVVVKIGASECMMHLGQVGKFLPVRILENGFGQLRHPNTGDDDGMPNPLSWFGGFYHDAEGWYGTDVYEINVQHSVTHSPGKFYVFVEGQRLFGASSLKFEETRDWAREMRARDEPVPDAEVRFVENSAFLPSWWSRSVGVLLDTEVREWVTGTVRDTWIDLPTHPNLFAGRHQLQEAGA
ncbi:hypothetical protein ACFXI8_27350 [Streptomyces niveus]|uniref:hypothetical protein n=1 Tax=Streptomyces niveus TaxID=193462 RepID=UPI00369B6036